MWKYINVRRLFTFGEQSIDRGTHWMVCEPNSEPTWIGIRTSITNFPRPLAQRRPHGPAHQEAFFARCDHTTMTQDDVDTLYTPCSPANSVSRRKTGRLRNTCVYLGV
jgi:phage tail sheath protein FI